MKDKTTAPVRKTDPGTSHAAAAGVSARQRSTVRSRVLAIFEAAKSSRDGLTHDQLIAEYRGFALRLGWPSASESSIRTRCNELWRDGLVERVPEADAKSRFGRAAILWRAVSVQISETGGNDGETA
ncbi:helix-turn-helix DNA-binding domain protein [Arthrobacter phage Andrew]|uniref:Helix-turn-helix DNA-binding domain protein n=1 Tax=Arthrobacter phage Andrew TaxID=2419946 RepID=A0A3G2KD02_9CAUD|nr:DNA binding protein [Arthrobacter phage Andrew]AYN56859.1 helix-turn-helix DNA-binding domain protein [Arthrobacter phage Andrew]